MAINIKRIYEPYSPDDGFRVLVDRLWPRGIKKEGSHIDRWMKEIAPSTALRTWFNHEARNWDEFRMKYHEELENSPAVKELLSAIKENNTVTLLFAAKDEEHNHAIVLREFLNDHDH